MSERISGGRRVLYALGNGGFQITDRVVVLIAVYFYLPPPGHGLVEQVPSRTVLGFVTVYGLASLFGRVFDALADPVVGHLSDRSTSRRGRRRVLLLWGIGPMVGVPMLLFLPPFARGSGLTGAWLGGLMAVYFIAFTAYVAPYFALIPEIAWSEAERVRLSVTMQVVALPALALVSAWGVGLDLGRAAGLSAADSVRWLVGVLLLLALVLCLGPIVGVDEGRHARGAASELPFRRALSETLRNRSFMLYLLAQIFFILGINLVQPLFPYLATVVLGRSEGFTLWFMVATGAGLGLGFALQRGLVARFGPKRAMMVCVGVSAVSVALLGLPVPDVPGGPRDGANLALVLGALGLFGIPAAGLMTLPHVLISQLIDADARRGGASRAAMFYGVQGLLTKWMYGISLWVLTFLLSRYGNSPAAPTGVLLVGPVASVCSLAALALYVFYPERSVLAAARPPSGT